MPDRAGTKRPASAAAAKQAGPKRGASGSAAGPAAGPAAPPGTALPGTALPGTALPGTAPPESAPPESALPGTALPGTALPGTAPPETAPPESALPGTALPGTAPPATASPGTALPGTALPATASPGTALPGTALPATAPPGTALPGTAPPGTAPPETALPGTAPPGTAPPATAPPETAPPGTAPPETALPATAPPGTAPPGTAPAGTAPRDQALPSAAQPARLGIRKTYKLFIGGGFPRSESGRSYPVTGADGALLAHAARASRKDARDAVTAARAAVGKWWGATAYNRGQVLYRVAELLEGRAAQFACDCVNAEGLSAAAAQQEVAAAIDRWVWYAGWPDKIAQVAGAANPVAGPYFNFSVPEPTGVVAVVAPARPSLLGLVSVLAPVIATGNTAVVVASEAHPLPAVTLAEVLATSDVPGGVVSVLTGFTAELAPVLAGHMDVNAIDLTGVAPAGRGELERLAAGNVKRVFAADEDWAAPPGPRRMLAFLETKTVWHPVGI